LDCSDHPNGLNNVEETTLVVLVIPLS